MSCTGLFYVIDIYYSILFAFSRYHTNHNVLKGQNGSVMYIWQLFFGKNPMLSKNELPECTDLDYFVDFCSRSQSLEECLKPYFHSSRENDVFVFNYAVVYALLSRCNPSFNLNSIVSVDAIIDFFRLIDSIFRGKVKIWVTTPHPKGSEGEKLYGVMSNIDMEVYEAMTLYRWMYRNKVTLANPSSEWVNIFMHA